MNLNNNHIRLYQQGGILSSTRDTSRHRTSSTSKGTQGKHSIPDIRDFIDEKSGKRKTQETTPEKQPLEKKSNSTCS